MRVLVCPDKFRGTLSARAAALAIDAGWRRLRPGDRIDVVPLADGGEGTLDALVAAAGGRTRTARVRGPLGDPVDASFGLIETTGGRTGVVELARASGLDLLAPSRRDALRATTWGTGELMLAACREGAGEVLVSVGGSATVDGGAGIAQALGIGLLDARERPIGPGGAGLLQLARIDLTAIDPGVRSARFVVATDVENPLTGPEGAARVFASQKGASAQDILVLERALGHLAAIVHRDLGLDVRSLPGGGAAGGVGAGLAAFLGAHLRPGAEMVMEAVGLRRRLASADVVVTGEGSFDAQTMHGKVVARVLAAARELGVPAAVLCGRAEIDRQDVLIASLVDRFGPGPAVDEPRRRLEDLAAEVAAMADRLSSPG
ncbi:MAG TPA: glycerate kinase [Actinomycetota bacterium]|nr:glycerate kinase [Actinomycetota bacterium]